MSEDAQDGVCLDRRREGRGGMSEVGKTYDTGQRKWQHGEIIEWINGNIPTRWYLGPCPRCGNRTINYGGMYSCLDDYCPNSAGVFVCRPETTPDWWNSDINVKKDGDQWCATFDDFVNLAESPAGFGPTPREAITNLRAADIYGEQNHPTPEPTIPVSEVEAVIEELDRMAVERLASAEHWKDKDAEMQVIHARAAGIVKQCKDKLTDLIAKHRKDQE